MVKLTDDVMLSPVDKSFFDTPPQGRGGKVGSFVLDRNGQINIDRGGIEDNFGFRLQEINHNTEMCSNKDIEEATTVSEYSNYKQRIDAMFDDSRSVASEKKHRRLLADLDDDSDRSIANNIQEKIEKMFEEISIHGFQGRSSIRTRKKENTLSHDFQVVFLGSKTLEDKAVSLVNLQDPLKELYFEFKRKRVKEEFNTLTISREGLRIKIGGTESLNPFPSIAVWASVKLTFREVASGTEYAFLPLVTDPDGIDKNVLFRGLRKEDRDAILDGVKGILDEGDQSPIFTVVMKNPRKQLECYGFVCKDSEDAIVIAANLYQALMKKMKRKKEGKKYENYKKIETVKEEEIKEQEQVRDPIKVKENFREMLNGSLREQMKRNESFRDELKRKESFRDELKRKESFRDELKRKESIRDELKRKESFRDELKPTEVEKKPSFKAKKTPPPVPLRPPRIRKKIEDEDQILELDEEEKPDQKMYRRGSVPDNVFSVEHEPVNTLRRSVSERRHNTLSVNEDKGDILTKVAIPRSRSFLNANGPHMRYSRRYKGKAQSDVASPLGFSELFNEFRLNEGLESMDDILSAIIDAEGMSFNDLKPIYKEFLLKLAVTLTKDELYQRSKVIMRRQRKKSNTNPLRKRAFMSTTGLRKVFRKTASKLAKQKNSRPATLEFTSVVFQSNAKHFETSTSSSSSGGKGVKRRPSGRKRPVKKAEKKKMSTTSEDSDFGMRRNTVESGGGPNRSSSGYFSCSECSYDSENCTCTSADKCYCTLGQNKKKNGNQTSTVESKFSEKDKSNPSLDVVIQYEKDKGSVTSCGCDTESCADSEKCYCEDKRVLSLSDVKGICQTPHLHQSEKRHNASCPNYVKPECKKHQTIFEQLRQQGFAASESSLSRAASPSTAWRDNEERSRRPKECLKTSRSLEFLQIRRPETRQQVHECPPPPPTRLEEVLLKEIQNNFVEGTRHFCYHGADPRSSFRYRQTPRRQYSSMRARNEVHMDPNQFHSCRYKNRLFSSMRSKQSCDNILNHVLFPETNSRHSSLRFPRRMDVYNSFNKGSYIDLLDQMQMRYPQPPVYPKPHVCPHEPLPPQQIYQSSGGSDNFQKLDYDLFTTSTKSEASETISNASDRKVLVVSARDPKGKVLYMGASSRGEKTRKMSAKGGNYADRNSANACEALSVKKSAEIAALFSDVPKSIRSSCSKEEKFYKECRRSNSYRCSNMENTLGYLP